MTRPTFAFLAAVALLLVAAPAWAVRAAPPPVPPVPWQDSGIDWTKAPASAKDRPFKPPVAEKKRLANGMTVLVVKNDRLPVFSMRLLVMGAGTTQDPAGKGGLAALTADLLDEGSGELASLAFAAEVERLGASIGTGADHECAVVSAGGLTRTFQPTLALFASLIMRPRFDEAEARRVMEDRKTERELRPDEPRLVAALWLW
jgi:zinc protease